MVVCKGEERVNSGSNCDETRLRGIRTADARIDFLGRAALEGGRQDDFVFSCLPKIHRPIRSGCHCENEVVG